MTVDAETHGNLFALVVGGALRTAEERTGNSSNTKPPTMPPPNKTDVTGLFAISVAVNVLDPIVTDAHVDWTNVTATQVGVSATYDANVRAVVVAAAFAITKQDIYKSSNVNTFSLNISLAGAFGVNTVNSTTTAGLTKGSLTATAGDASITASDTTTYAVDAGGAAFAIALKGRRGALSLAIGISVGINTIGSSTLARASGSEISASRDVIVTASSTISVEAVTIAAAAAGSGDQTLVPEKGNFTFSGAGAGSGNAITSTVEASITNATDADPTKWGINAGGGVDVRATDTSTSRQTPAASRSRSSSARAASSRPSRSASRPRRTRSRTASTRSSATRRSRRPGKLQAISTDGIRVEAVGTPQIQALTIAGAVAATRRGHRRRLG